MFRAVPPVEMRGMGRSESSYPGRPARRLTLSATATPQEALPGHREALSEWILWGPWSYGWDLARVFQQELGVNAGVVPADTEE